MDSLMNAQRGRGNGSARGRKLVPILWGLAAVVVVVGAIWAWPHVFGPGGDKGPKPMLPGDVVENRTPDPAGGQAGGSPFASTPVGLGGNSSTPSPTPTPTPSLTPTPPPSAADGAAESADAAALMAEAAQKEAAGQAVEARKLYSEALGRNPNAAQRAAIVMRVEEISGRTILGSKAVQGDPDTDTYQVQSGDYLATIGRRYQIPYPLIMRLNGMSSDRIRAGQKLKVVKGPFRVRIIKSTFTLELWLRGNLVKTFRVAIGADDSTPVGTFEVTETLVNPTFYPPEGMRGSRAVIEGGHPDNPLGTRWIRFGEKSLGLGIHGTNEPQSIGKQVSLGCIRMLNADAEFVYDCLVTGSQVEVAK